MNKVFKIYLRVFMFLMPLYFLPIVVGGNDWAKNWFLIVGAMVGLVLWIADLLVGRKDKVRTSKFLLLVWGLAVWSGVEWWRMGAGLRTRTWVGPFGFGTWLAMGTWAFLWLQATDTKLEFKKQMNFLTVAGLLAAVSSLIVFLLPVSRMPINIPNAESPLVVINQGWSLTGSLINEVVLLAFLAWEWITRVVKKLKSEEGGMNYIWEMVVAAVLVLVALLDIFRIYKLGWVILDFTSSWVIAVEVFKRSPIFGIGAGNFAQAFDLFRPNSFNMTPYWANLFNVSGMGWLQIWTELGLVGMVLLAGVILNWLRSKKNNEFWRIGFLLVVVLLMPLNLMALFLLIWVLVSRSGEVKEHRLWLGMGENNFNSLPYLTAMVMLVLVGWTMTNMVQQVRAGYYMRESLVAAGKNDATKTYNLQIKAIEILPSMADYRNIYSQTNLAIASSLLSQEDISDEDKEKVSVLLQQAVQEGKTTVSLDSLNPHYWANLASIYRAMVGVLDGSADWAYQAYTQATALDPADPMTKLDLGGLLYASNNFEEADRVFEDAVMAKQDLANAWYNWAYSAKQMNRIDLAVQRLGQAVALVPVDSGDYETANKELTAWKKELDEAIKQQQAALAAQQKAAEEKEPETLKAPEPLPTVGEEEEVNVPAEGLEPPEVAVTPTPVPSQTPSPSVAPTGSQ